MAIPDLPRVLLQVPSVEPYLLSVQAVVSILVILAALKSYINGEIRGMIESIQKIDAMEGDIRDIERVLIALARATEDDTKRVPAEKVRETFYGDRRRPSDYIDDGYETRDGEPHPRRFVEDQPDDAEEEAE